MTLCLNNYEGIEFRNLIYLLYILNVRINIHIYIEVLFLITTSCGLNVHNISSSHKRLVRSEDQ